MARLNSRRLYVYLFIGALAVGSVLLYFSAVSDIMNLPEKIEKHNEDGSLLERAVIWRNMKDGSKLKLEASFLKRTSKRIDATDVRATLFRDEEPVYEAVAEKAFYDVHSKKIVLKGSVKVHEVKEDTTLYTDELQWDTEKGFISTKASVKIVKGKDTEITGKILKGSVSTGKWTIEENVKITILEGGG